MSTSRTHRTPLGWVSLSTTEQGMSDALRPHGPRSITAPGNRPDRARHRAGVVALAVTACLAALFAAPSPAGAGTATGCGTVLLPGSQWLGGQGVDVRSNGTGYGGSCTGGSAGFGYQCVDPRPTERPSGAISAVSRHNDSQYPNPVHGLHPDRLHSRRGLTLAGDVVKVARRARTHSDTGRWDGNARLKAQERQRGAPGGMGQRSLKSRAPGGQYSSKSRSPQAHCHATRPDSILRM